ncbi:MAG: M20/M25/M40 family metallo-hydrolase [Clostridiales bacterium]|nr:M20/M25/M40 family metallo-hydrolase [Clostridiales bacterium]
MSAERLLETFLALARIDSPSFAEGALARHCALVLSEIGFTVRVDDSARVTGSDTGNIVATLPAVDASASTLVLSAHLDCVQPCEGVEPVVRDGVIRSAGETVLGADDKAGIAAIIEGVTRAMERGVAHGEIRVVLTVAEEAGLSGAKALDLDAVRGDLCLVLDADGPPGGIVVGAPTHHTFVAKFSGVAAHAGVAPEKGVSALLMAAEAVRAMPLGRLDLQTTANAGTLRSGSATNVVPATAELTGECRSLDDVRVEEVRQAMDTAMREAAARHGGRVEIAWERQYGAFAVPADAPVLAVVRDACGDIGVEPRLFTTGGGSDASVFAASGAPTLVLSCGMHDVHSASESIALADMEALAALVEAVISRLARPR